MKRNSITIQENGYFIYLTKIQVLEENEKFVIFTKDFSITEMKSLESHFSVKIFNSNVKVYKNIVSQLNGIKY